MYPLKPSVFDKCYYDPKWYKTDFFHSRDGIKEFPEHHCKLTWELSKPFIKNTRNAVDVGCREGEYTRYLFNTFGHTYCFDDRKCKTFAYNVDLKKVTHFTCLLGNETSTKRIIDNDLRKGFDKTGKFYRLDDFNLAEVDYIKIDTDGYEMAVILGGLKTITRDWPIIALEVAYEEQTLNFCLNELGYKQVAMCDRGWDRILIKE